MVTFACSHCGRKLQIKEALAGKRAKCPGCGQLVAVPAEPSPVGAGGLQTLPTLTPPELPGPLSAETPSAVSGETVPVPSSASYDFLAPPQQPDELGRLGTYRVLRVLGAGGMGIVFQAEDPQLRRLVALKVINPSQAGTTARQRFLREARATAALAHDHVVTIHHVGEDRGVPFLAMQFLQGESLDDRLKREGKLPVPEVLRIGREMAEGLAAAHERGLVHRDIKPGNVWLEGKSGRVKLLDFGLARVSGDEPHLTQTGNMLGTPAYMAPEQAGGEEVDARCDLFSLGAVLYRLCTGELPFKGNDTMSILLSLATHQPKPPHALNAEVPVALSNLVMRLLAKDRAGRPASAQVVAEELAAIAAREGKTERLALPKKIGPRPAPLVPAAAARASDATIPVESEPAPRPRAKAGRGRTLLLVALLLVVLVPLGWWLATVLLRVETADGTLVVAIDDPETEARIKNGKLILTGPDDKVRYTLAPSERNKKIDAGPYKIHVEGADGLTLDTPEFTLTKGGKVVVRVTVDSPAVAKNPDPDRKAAEWALSIGGTVRVNGQDRDIKAAADLPPKAFQLASVNLHENKQVSDAGLAHFKDCKDLTQLDVHDTAASDAGLAYFKDCKNLTMLSVGSTQVSDAGLAYFRDCRNLMGLYLRNTKVGDAGLANFKDCKNLLELDLLNTQVSDAGLAYFKDCKNLTGLWLNSTQVSGAGLIHFKDCKNLMILDLGKTKVGDMGLTHLKDCQNLTYLNLNATPVSNAGLAYFEGCKNLMVLDLGSTQVSDAGVAPFRDSKNLTQLVLHDTQVGDVGLANFRDCRNLMQLGLHGTKVSDTGLALFKDCKNLTTLQLGATQVGDAGLAHFRDCKNLTELGLHETKVSDTGLAYFKDCKNLMGLWLGGTQVSDVGLAHLKDCKNLTGLNLGGTKVSDAGLAYFKDCKDLTYLHLGGTQVSDLGLAHLKGCNNLTYLGVRETKVTAAKIEELKKALPKCKLEWDGGIIEPRASLDPDRRAAARLLSLPA